MKSINPLLLTDSYKLSHEQMFPEGTDFLYSNFTNRGSRVDGVNHVVFYGLQAFLTDLTERFEWDFFSLPKEEVIADYKRNVSTFVSPGFTVDHIERLHDLGYLPLEFRAVREGTLVPIRVPSFTIENTVAGFGWLVNYLETWISTGVWHPSTSATTAWNFRRVLDAAAEATSDTPGDVDFQLHDFSFRGMENWQAAAASASAHLISFRGTDAVPALSFVDEYYPGEDNGLVGASVPATEHSVMCAGIATTSEQDTFERLLNQYPEGILSVVSDTEDLWKVLTEFLPNLKDQIMSREGKLVIRPDSGDPIDILCGSVIATGLLPNGNPVQKGVIELLWDVFGGTVNSKGYKVLDSHIGAIYGDSITLERAKMISMRLKAKGFASTNVVLGAGSFSYQYVTRDTFSSAVKATEATINGESVNLQKNPVTDNGTKKSATGRLAVLSSMSGVLNLIEKASPEQEENSFLKPVWRDGKFLRTQSFNEVRTQLILSTEILERAGEL